MSDIPDARPVLQRAFDQTASVLAAVSADHLDLPTPCEDWCVRELAGHLLFGAERIGIAGRREPIVNDGPPIRLVADDEVVSSFRDRAKEALDAWSGDDALDGEIVLPFGTWPSAMVVWMYAQEQVAHAWDLASAIGVTEILDPALAEGVLPLSMKMLPSEPRGGFIPFAPVVDVSPDAPAYDKLVAWLGRWPESATPALDPERADLLQQLASARHWLQFPTRDLDDEQARRRTTVSELCLGGLVKHVTKVERDWAAFIVHGAEGSEAGKQSDIEAHLASFRMGEDDTLAGLLEDYAAAASATDELVRTLPDLSASQELAPAPWFEPGTRWSARRVLLHIIGETCQHAGHADFLREAIDGAKSMG